MKQTTTYQVTVKELQKHVNDRITDVYTEGKVTVVQIPNGRVKIMPEHRRPQPKYSLRNGGRKTTYILSRKVKKWEIVKWKKSTD